MPAEISFSDDVATVSVDGSVKASLGWLYLVATGIGAVLCFTVKVFLFTIFGCLLVAVLPFAIWEFIKVKPALSYQLAIDKACEEVSRTNSVQGHMRRKTGKFVEVQVLNTRVPGKWSVRVYYVQLRCDQGLVWVDAGLTAEGARQIASSLANWLGVELKSPKEIPYTSAITAKLLLPRYNPWTAQA